MASAFGDKRSPDSSKRLPGPFGSGGGSAEKRGAGPYRK
jgi:hypothetical protein